MEENQACSFRPANFVFCSRAKKLSLQSGLKQSNVTLFTLLNAQNNEKKHGGSEKESILISCFHHTFSQTFYGRTNWKFANYMEYTLNLDKQSYIILKNKLFYFVRKEKFFYTKIRLLRERKHYGRKKMFWVPPSRAEQCWLNIIKGIAPAVKWKTKFRMLKSWFDYFDEEIAALLSPDPISRNRRAIWSQKSSNNFAVPENTGSLIVTANIFGIAKNGVGKVVHGVCYAISKYLWPKYLTYFYQEIRRG